MILTCHSDLSFANSVGCLIEGCTTCELAKGTSSWQEIDQSFVVVVVVVVSSLVPLRCCALDDWRRHDDDETNVGLS